MGRWSPEEDARLRALWACGTSTEMIGGMLGRSKCSVIGRADRLGLPEHVMSRNTPWSADEDTKILRMRSRGVPMSRIAAAIPGRTVRAVECRYYKTLKRLAAPVAVPIRQTEGV